MLLVAHEAIGPGIGNRNANAATPGADGRRGIHLEWRVPQHARIMPIYPDLSQTMKRSQMQNHPFARADKTRRRMPKHYKY